MAYFRTLNLKTIINGELISITRSLTDAKTALGGILINVIHILGAIACSVAFFWRLDWCWEHEKFGHYNF